MGIDAQLSLSSDPHYVAEMNRFCPKSILRESQQSPIVYLEPHPRSDAAGKYDGNANLRSELTLPSLLPGERYAAFAFADGRCGVLSGDLLLQPS